MDIGVNAGSKAARLMPVRPDPETLNPYIKETLESPP